MSEQTLEERVELLEKEIAELKRQVSERPDVEELAKELFTRLSLKARDSGITS